jgi:hypothetical protein
VRRRTRRPCRPRCRRSTPAAIWKPPSSPASPTMPATRAATPSGFRGPRRATARLTSRPALPFSAISTPCSPSTPAPRLEPSPRWPPTTTDLLRHLSLSAGRPTAKFDSLQPSAPPTRSRPTAPRVPQADSRFGSGAGLPTITSPTPRCLAPRFPRTPLSAPPPGWRPRRPASPTTPASPVATRSGFRGRPSTAALSRSLPAAAKAESTRCSLSIPARISMTSPRSPRTTASRTKAARPTAAKSSSLPPPAPRIGLRLTGRTAAKAGSP